MASHSSANNLWQITALSFSPSIITLGQTVQMTATYKNVSGGSMSHFANYAHIIPHFKTADGGQYVLPGIEIPFPLKYGTFFDSSLPNNGALTVTQTLDFTLPEDAPALDLTSRCLQPFVVHPASYDYPDGTILGLCVEITGQKNGGDFYTDRFYDISDNYGGDLVILSHNWNPAASLSVKRGLANGSASDEGERLLVTAKLSKNEYADASAMFCRLYYEENGTATTSSSYIDLTSSISALLAGVTDDASLVTQTFSNGSNWSFLLVFGDDYETASAPASIALAFANVHMSGASTGGVAFGRFSSSSEGNPKFECAYPATFEQPVNADGGIEGVTNYASGEVDTGGTWVDGKPIYRYTAVFNASIGSSATNIHTIPSGHDKIIRLSLLMDNIRPVPYWAASSYWASIYINGNNIRAQAGSSEQKSHSFVLVMEYTRN